MPTASTRFHASCSIPSTHARAETVADLLKRLGNIPASRVRLQPVPGTATERDLLWVLDHENCLCELVEGVLVDKPMGYEESVVAARLIISLGSFVQQHNLGIVSAPDGPMRLWSGLVRMPDVAFVSWDRLPGRKQPKKPIPHLAPDLAVEVLSKSNTKAEMARKLKEYFEAGVQMVWLIEPRSRTVRVHTTPDQFSVLREDQALDGGSSLPGFTMGVRDLFPTEKP